MDLDIVFIGTAASVPSPGRGLSSALIRRGGDRILIDCGEGTQRQLMRSVGLVEIDVVLLTHMHADHVLGLPGMLKTFGLREREQPLVICGPPGIERFWQTLQPLVGRLPFELEIVGVDEGVVWGGDGYTIDAVPTDHTVPSVGYLLSEPDRPGRFDVELATDLGVQPGPDFGRLQRGESVAARDGSTIASSQVVGEARSGRRIMYTGDTRACAAVRDAAHNVDVLIHEATFLNDDVDRAAHTGHSTARDAALIALVAGAKMLGLTHISTRYRPRDVQAEAREVMANATVMRDFDLIEVPFAERGIPTLIQHGGRPRVDDKPNASAPEPCEDIASATT